MTLEEAVRQRKATAKFINVWCPICGYFARGMPRSWPTTPADAVLEVLPCNCSAERRNPVWYDAEGRLLSN